MPRKLHLPLGTRLELITQHEDGTWRIWTGINDKNIPVERALGTYIELYLDGSAVMSTRRPNEEEEYQCLSPKKS